MQDAKAINPLTSLRFFAAMWVVAFHYWPNLSAVMPPIVAKGYLGVELFFVLSGFILSHVYLDAVADGGFRYGNFLWARLARIYPMHLATLIGVGAMGLGALAIGRSIDSNVLAWTSLPANLLLLQAWGFAPQAGWNHPSWSISAEWFAYLGFPLVAWGALKLKSKPIVAIAAALAFMSVLYAVFDRLAGFPLTSATINWGALRIVPCFVYGSAVNLLWRESAAGRRTWAFFGALFSGAGVLALAQVSAPDTLLVSLFGGLIFSLALLAKSGGNTGGGNIFVYLGEISYSSYMICIPWQLLFVNVVASALHVSKEHMPLYLWLIMFSAVIPLSAASYHLIERPARAWMRRGAAPHGQPAPGVA